MSVVDVNDSPPQFSKTFYEVDVDENVHSGFQVTTLPVYDDDEIGGLSLTIENPTDANLKINLDSKCFFTYISQNIYILVISNN